MKSLETNSGHRHWRHRASGFSLIEMVSVLAIIIVLASISFISLVPVMKQQRVANAYNTALSAMRQARDNAVSQRTSYSVTFATSASPVTNTITVAPMLTTFQGAQSSVTYQLPTDVSFLAQSGLPATAPDGYGSGLAAIDFGYTAHATGGAHDNAVGRDGPHSRMAALQQRGGRLPMAASVIARNGNSRAPKRAEGGFSLLEVVISMAVLTVGLVSLLGVFGLAMASTQTSQQDMIAKQLANEELESIVTARNTSQLGWDDIQNVGSTNCSSGAGSCGIFLVGMNPIYNSGPDGIFGTGDDTSAGEQTLQQPGPDGIYGSADDVKIPLTGFQRKILISPVYDSNGNLVISLRGVNVTVQYATTQANLPKTYVLSSFISQYQ